jgi:ribosomal protein S7
MDTEAETKIIQQFVDKGNYHAAMNISISALNECRRNNNQRGIEIFLDVIKDIANTMAGVFGRQQSG